MSPYQHGEVFVTDDGAETDLDLGHYERFTGVRPRKGDNITTGRIYPGHHRQGAARRLSRRDGAGDPARHRRHQGIRLAATTTIDFVLCRDRRHGRRHRGPAVLRGDPPARQRTAARPVHLHPPDAAAVHPSAGELKTKPTQHSVKELRSIGIQPDILLCRCDRRSRRERARSRCSAMCARAR
jgi:CTP synthase